MPIPLFVPFGGDEIRQRLFAEARIVVLPLPYEQAVSYGTGTASGPFELLSASLQLEMIDEETLIEFDRLALCTLQPPSLSTDAHGAVAQMKNAALQALSQGKALLSLGGDHAVSIGPIAAAAELFPGMGVLQIDAHLDLRDEWNGSRWNHACVMRRVVDDLGLPIVQVGIRSFCAQEAALVRQRGYRPFYAHAIDPQDHRWIDEVIAALPPTVYLTIDLDGLDPSALPGTGTPEPGGLSYRQLLALMRAVGSKRRVVAADITELSKIPGTQVSEFTAAKIASKIMVYCWSSGSA